jgi:hypothetical protein
VLIRCFAFWSHRDLWHGKLTFDLGNNFGYAYPIVSKFWDIKLEVWTAYFIKGFGEIRCRSCLIGEIFKKSEIKNPSKILALQ